MSEYSSKTVTQLKEILKQKNLSTDGKKADLIQRLTESETKEEVPEAEPVQEEAPVANGDAEATASADAPEDATLTVVQPETPAEPEKPKVLTAEERKALAIDLLNKKIARAVKFGDEAAAETARKDLNRVEKFGVETGTALAREIGIVDQGLPNHKRKFNKKFNGKHKKNFKPQHGSRGRERSS